jgi:hypothetical protein
MTTPQPSSGGGNVWTRRVGPLPLWGWAGIGLGGFLVLFLFRKNKASSSTTGQSSSTVDTPGGVDASLVPQFVNQVYTQGTPPPAPNVTVNNQIPPDNDGPPSVTPPPNHVPPKVHQYPAPQGLKVSNITRSSIKVSWKNLTSPQPAPGSYTVAVYNKSGHVVSQSTVNAPDTTGGNTTTTLTGLPNGQGPFQVHVWANGGALAPPHASSTFKLS